MEPVLMAGFELSQFERQLLMLALDGSSRGGEISTSATKLIESLRAAASTALRS